MLKEVENMRRKHLQEEIEKEVIASLLVDFQFVNYQWIPKR